MKRTGTILLIAALFGAPALATEGMWPPHQLPEIGKALGKAGLAIAPEVLSDLTGHPMNAVISLGGCTASFVSPEGLVVTNHHCAYGSIQYNSTEEKNLLRDGFVAQTPAEEPFAGPGSRVLVTVGFDDVTKKIIGGLDDDLAPRARYQEIEDREKSLVADCESEPGYRCRIASFHGGLQYFRIRQLEIKDVRLVYAPAGPIGKYGGDVDNWMWPRHTGDFSLYRAYVSPEGKPAEYDEKNVPYEPAHWLRVGADGVAPGDFVMVAGYPGRTNRYRLAREAQSTIDWRYPTIKAELESLLEIIETETAERPDAAIKYASTVASFNNVTKNYAGMLEGFGKSDIIERKSRFEEEFASWIAGDGSRRARYGGDLDALVSLVREREAVRERSLYYGFLGRRSALLGAARTLYRLAVEKEKPDAEREPGYQERDFARIRERMVRMERTFDPDVDRALWKHGIGRYASIPSDQHIRPFDAWLGLAGGALDDAALSARIDAMYEATALGDKDSRVALMEASAKEMRAHEDPFIKLAAHLFESDMTLEEEEKEVAGRFQSLRPRVMEARIAFLRSRGQAVYPDANSTLRVTYGHVKGYAPRDAVSYTPFTKLEGILEKDTGDAPFDAPAAQLEAIRARRYAGWSDASLGSVPVNFLSTVDTTGGNSGSPTLNAKGELVGLLFDGNWESINADWDFNPAITRSIHVEIRYMLWVMDVLDGARHLLAEMGVESRAAAIEAAAAAGEEKPSARRAP